jgi:CDP-diacylglycerol---glycerol-3-phosphate 3-phosphatidyltransferase
MRLADVPNALTIGRLLAVPVMAIFFMMEGDWAAWTATWLFVAAGLTDWLDGYLARKYNLGSSLGAFLDPVADKLLVATALILLTWQDPTHLMVVMAFLIISREIVISALREWMAQMGSSAAVKVSDVGKWKTLMQLLGLGFMMPRQPVLGLPFYEFGALLLSIATVLTVWSMFRYLRAAWPVIKNA